jgi:hypothetical protein
MGFFFYTRSFLCVFFFFFHFLHAKSASIDRKVYIIHMDQSVMPKPFTNYHNWYSSTLNSLTSPQSDHLSSLSLIYTFNHAFHGFSAFLSLNELEALKKSLGFISGYRDIHP